MSPESLRRELMMLLTLESLPWHIRLLIGTHLLENDPFEQVVDSTTTIADPLLALVVKTRRQINVGGKETVECDTTAMVKDKYSMELVTRLMLDRDQDKVNEYKKNFEEVKASLESFTKKYPWAPSPAAEQ